MDVSCSDWDSNCASSSTKPNAFNDNDFPSDLDNANMPNYRHTQMGIDKTSRSSVHLASKRRAAKEPYTHLKYSKKLKLLNPSSTGEKVPLLQDQFVPDSILSTIGSNQNSSSLLSINQENSKKSSVCNQDHGSSREDLELENCSPLYALSSGKYPKITDLLTEHSPDGLSLSSHGGCKMVNSNEIPLPSCSSSPHVCPKCSRSFRTKLLLVHHSDTHDPNKNHRCTFPDCERAFRSQKYLENHINDHHRASPSLRCAFPSCGFIATRKAELRRHKTTKHKHSSDINDEFFNVIEEVLSRNLKEIYETLPAASPALTLANGEYFSPDGTSSTLSAPSFSTGGCMAGAPVTPQSANLPLTPPTSCPSRCFIQNQSQIPDPTNIRWYNREPTSACITATSESPYESQLPDLSIQPTFKNDYIGISQQGNRIQNDYDSSFQPDGFYNYSQPSYAPSCDYARPSPILSTHPSYYPTPQKQPSAVMPYRHCEKQSPKVFPFSRDGSAYGHTALTRPTDSFSHNSHQSSHYIQQQPFYQRSPQRQCQMNAQQLWSAELSGMAQHSLTSAYSTAPQDKHQQRHEFSGLNWHSCSGYYQSIGFLRRSESGVMDSPGIFQTVAQPPPFPYSSLKY